MTDENTKQKLDELQCRLVAHRSLTATLLSAVAAQRPDSHEFLAGIAKAMTNSAENLPVWREWRETYIDEVQSTIAMATTFTPK
ncbi:hypothetical protein [Burkholderia sp. HI2714]|uniref:hypothetical protein n=1 Tax=Burkholderia sp. HI2714 TaxID=2015359 RepID=UPI001180CB6E|nr:hypothetical protein [Burkholderia sp. HI2714]